MASLRVSPLGVLGSSMLRLPPLSLVASSSEADPASEVDIASLSLLFPEACSPPAAACAGTICNCKGKTFVNSWTWFVGTV